MNTKPLTREQVRSELEKKGCIYQGHFVGVSGKHLAGYCNIDPVMPHASLVGELARLLVEAYANDNVQTVVVPAVGAIPLAHWGAHHLSLLTGREVLGVWADKDKSKPQGFAFERSGFLQAVKGRNCLLLEDMINQMKSVSGLVSLTRECGGHIVGVGAIATNRGVSAEAIGVPRLEKLCAVEYDVWTPEDCVRSGLCSRNIPIITDIGHGDKYQAANPNYAGGYAKMLKG